MTGGQDHEADALTDFQRTDEAVEQENRWRDANGWNDGSQPTDARLQQQEQQKPWELLATLRNLPMSDHRQAGE